MTPSGIFKQNFNVSLQRTESFSRKHAPETVELIHDAFQPLDYWSDFMTGSNFTGVAIDTHIYQMFSVDVFIKFSPEYSSSLTASDIAGKCYEQHGTVC